MSAPFVSSLRRDVRGGEESAQLSRISDLLDTVVLSNMGDRRFWDLNGDGCFRVKDVRRLLDDMLLPKSDVPSRWVKQIPIKVNVLAWKISMDRLPTRVNLHRRGVQVSPISCPICCEALENLDHLLFCCDLAKDIARSICNWWGLVWNPVDSYRSWLSWFNLVQLQSSSKQVLEGVFYTSWWSIWSYRNHLLFSDSNLRKDGIFEDIDRRSFSNNILVNFCDEKGVSQNFFSPHTPEQNDVTERKNRTLIEAARTMLSGSVFLKQYWAEAVATAFYTQNRSTIVKRHLKTPYEIFRGRLPNINLLHVFGCPVFIHNYKDHLGKFDEKADDGYSLGHSLVSKAFRVFNTRRQQTKETYHITFNESTKAIKFSKPFEMKKLMMVISLDTHLFPKPSESSTPEDNKLKKHITSHLMKALMLSNSQNFQMTTSPLLNLKDTHLMNIFIYMNPLKGIK
ncbi:RNA-directed DNA polymerase, eukaryota [Tanacetum coccineum]